MTMTNKRRFARYTLACIAMVMVFTSGIAVGTCDPQIVYVDKPVVVEVERIVETIVIQAPEEETVEEIAVIEEVVVAQVLPEIEPQPISRDFDITQPCGYTADELRYMVSDDSRKAMLPYVDILLEAEEKYGVNAFYLLCKFGYESGWGKHMAASNNIGGWTNGQGGYRAFDSVEQCIFTIAENLSTVYVNAVGTRLEDVSRRYCPNEEYVSVLLQIMSGRAYALSEVSA